MNNRALVFIAFSLGVAGAPLKVVCFGDSTTAPRKNVIPYCEQLAQWFSESPIIFVNRGVPGNTTADAKKRFDSDVLDDNPDLVFIQFGINDSTVDVWKKPPATIPRVAVVDYSENLSSFVQSLQSRKIVVVLMTFNPLMWAPKTRELYGAPPYNPGQEDGFNIGRNAYLDAMRGIAERFNVRLLDIDKAYRSFAEMPEHSLNDLLLDGIHPNSTGQKITADLARPVIVELMRDRRNAN